jgi:hypothetical protein
MYGIKFTENPLSAYRVVRCGQTDVAEANYRILLFCNTSMQTRQR